MTLVYNIVENNWILLGLKKRGMGKDLSDGFDESKIQGTFLYDFFFTIV